MSYLRSALRKIGSGLLFGIGFGISAGSIFYVASEIQMDQVKKSTWNEEAGDRVVITNHEKVTRDGSVSVLGAVENRGEDLARGLVIQVDLFDKSGKFVDQCEEYMRGTVRAGESRNFKVACKSAVEHETYKVRVAGV
jgi:hypothetical protein